MTPHEPNGLKLGFASVVSKGNQVVRLPVVKGVNTEIKMIQAVIAVHVFILKFTPLNEFTNVGMLNVAAYRREHLRIGCCDYQIYGVIISYC